MVQYSSKYRVWSLSQRIAEKVATQQSTPSEVLEQNHSLWSDNRSPSAQSAV
jgi:hypothetical protein